MEPRHERLRAYLEASPNDRCRMSTVAIAEATGLTQRFVGRTRGRYTPPELRDAPRVGRSGNAVTTQGVRMTAAEHAAVRIGELERALASAERTAAEATARADTADAAAADSAKALAKLQDSRARLQLRQERLRRTDPHRLRMLAQKLLWNGWTPTQLQIAIEDRQLLSHTTSVPLTNVELHLVRELYAEKEGEVLQRYQTEWKSRGYGALARAEAAALGLSLSQFADPDNPARRMPSASRVWADSRRDTWVLDQMEARPCPDGEVDAFVSWSVTAVDDDDVPDDVPEFRVVEELVTPEAVARAMVGGVVVVRFVGDGGRTLVVEG